MSLRYLHTMVRVSNVERSLDFYCAKLGMEEVRRVQSEAGRYTLVFLAAPDDKGRSASERAPLLELTFNWDPETYGEGRNFGHLAYEVEDIYAVCDRLMKAGVTINRPPRDGRMAFVRSPDNVSIELLRKGEAQPKRSHGRRCPTLAGGDAPPSPTANVLEIRRSRCFKQRSFAWALSRDSAADLVRTVRTW